jgi:hypothetical protein
MPGTIPTSSVPSRRPGKKKMLIAGLWTETCVALVVVQAIHDGYQVYVVEDCCGDISTLAHENAMRRIIQAGAIPVTALSVMLEWQRDWAEKDTYEAVTGIIKSHLGAYGMGVEYATTLVHGGAPTALPRYEVPGALRARRRNLSRSRPREDLSLLSGRRGAGRHHLWPAERAITGPAGGRPSRAVGHPRRRAGNAAAKRLMAGKPVTTAWLKTDCAPQILGTPIGTGHSGRLVISATIRPPEISRGKAFL